MISLYCNHGALSCNCVVTDNWKEADISVWMLDNAFTLQDVVRIFERSTEHPDSAYVVLLDEGLQGVAESLEQQSVNVYRDLGAFMDKMEEVLYESSI